MNDTRPNAAALLLGGLLLTTTLGAQSSGVIVKPVPLDDTPKVMPLGPAEDPSTGGFCGTTDVQLIGDNHILRVIGGTPGNKVAILIGLQQADIPLPGGDVLRIDPLLVLTLGAFDETGEYAYELQYDGETVEPVTVFAQAISVMGDSTTFDTSGVITIEFDGSGGFTTGPVAMVTAPGWVMPGQRATRRGMLA